MFLDLEGKRKSFTKILKNIMTPIIYNGIKSIYNQANKISTSDNVLKNFQTMLSEIPKWDTSIVEREYGRILGKIESANWLENIIYSILKVNIELLVFNPYESKLPIIDPNYYNKINIREFIHKIYIECAREFWMYPYSFYHNYPIYELKRNERESKEIIMNAIEEAIQKLLPMKFILNRNLNMGIDRKLTEKEVKKIETIVKKDLTESKKNYQSSITSTKNYSTRDTRSSTDTRTANDTRSVTDTKSATNVNKVDAIKKIVNNPNLNLSTNTQKVNSKYLRNSVSHVDTKIKNILENDLANTEANTTLSKNNTTSYREVFSNSDTNNSTVSERNSNDRNTLKNQRKFFQNYMKI